MTNAFCRIAWVFALVTTVGASMPGTTLAGDDGGGRSVFATGAGNRALAMGGAYTALANDASSPLWNPAGLGLVQRRELEFSQTNYYDLGINEQYGSLVLPNWRWGTTSLTFRHFGVSGIEERDDRNVLLSDDLSDSELEFALGFGRRMGTHWSIGSVVKLQHQNLAGFGDTGVGIDFGVMAHPLAMFYPNNLAMQRLSVGLFIRNAVQPVLRLSQERVEDPTGARLGFAYMLPLWGNRPLTLAMDIEQTRGMDTSFHSGAEIAIHPLLRLRAGVGNGVMTAGTGTTWNGVGVDYTFENNNFDMVHRIGASFSFGATVDERRIVAREAEENEMEERLAQLYEQRRNERVGQLLDDARQVGAQGDYHEAIRILDVVTTLEPDHMEANRRKNRYYHELGQTYEIRGEYADAALSFSQALTLDPNDSIAKEGIRRCRALGDELAARSQVIRQRFSDALDAFSRNDLVDAREGFKATLELAPDDKEAIAMLERTVSAIDLRVANLLEQANRMIEWKRFSGANQALEEARSLDANAPRLKQTARRLSQAKATHPENVATNGTTGTTPPGGGTGTPDGKPKPLTEDQKKEVEYLYKRATTAMSKNKIDEAVRYWELVWSISPSYERVAEHLKGEYLRRGMEYYADGDLGKAVDLWEQALRIDPTDHRTKGYLSRARGQKARASEIFGGRG